MALNATAIAMSIKNTLTTPSEQTVDAYPDGQSYAEIYDPTRALDVELQDHAVENVAQSPRGVSVADRVQEQLALQAAREEQVALEIQQGE